MQMLVLVRVVEIRGAVAATFGEGYFEAFAGSSYLRNSRGSGVSDIFFGGGCEWVQAEKRVRARMVFYFGVECGDGLGVGVGGF